VVPDEGNNLLDEGDPALERYLPRCDDSRRADQSSPDTHDADVNLVGER
jgi:hypothetical protein